MVILQPHIKCKKGDVARHAIIPGDPARVRLIAKYFDNPKEIAFNREFLTITGEYKGIRITATSTGIGCPSAAIAIEEAKFSNPSQFNRNLQSLVQQKGFMIRGLVLGRFQRGAMTEDQLIHILQSKRELRDIPIIANADFGHTDPKATIPIGGTARMQASSRNTFIEFTEH